VEPSWGQVPGSLSVLLCFNLGAKSHPCNGSIQAQSRLTSARSYMARLSVFNLLI
jgi:hypothetical protein